MPQTWFRDGKWLNHKQLLEWKEKKEVESNKDEVTNSDEDTQDSVEESNKLPNEFEELKNLLEEYKKKFNKTPRGAYAKDVVWLRQKLSNN